MIKIVISGILGKMGTRIAMLAGYDKDIEIVGGLEDSSNSAIGKNIGEFIHSPATGTSEDKPATTASAGNKIESDFNKIVSFCDALIEFTSPSATLRHLETAVRNQKAVVIGTTGFSKDEIELIKKASLEIPIVFSPNMSIGANLMFKITEELARILGDDYEAEIVEAHHDQKKDAPSGTAKRLGEAIFKVKGKAPPIHSVRLGDIVGDHTVIFATDGERIELTHRAHSRDAFAKGSLDAAKFLVGRKPGLYTMQDVIGHISAPKGV